ncbi:MAG TPA: type III-A CRISPR-associated protein Csm2 [Clostridiales bacterium]|mgnify:CR=1 FL=1|nr:type III-A CRISPR-associated protein Csm2 [Clostridiales bacterium]
MVKLNELTYVTQAENVIKNLEKDRYGNIYLTTSKIRNLLGMISEIYNEAAHETGAELSIDLQSRIQYLKLRFVYEAGRKRAVKDFVEKAGILQYIDHIGKSRDGFLLFCKYMEALVAYHKYYGGRD